MQSASHPQCNSACLHTEASWDAKRRGEEERRAKDRNKDASGGKNRVIGSERGREMESGGNKEMQCEIKNEGKLVRGTEHRLSGPLFLPKSGEQCCFFACPFLLCHPPTPPPPAPEL